MVDHIASSKRNILPPLDYFIAFEAAAQLGSFASASRKLNVSETAISRKIRLLEQHYDLPLFLRGNRSVSVTPQGRELLATVEESLNVLRTKSQDLIRRNGTSAVNLGATNSIASLWLMPRLKKFALTNGHVQIALTASDHDAECLSDQIDLSILRGDGNWPGYNAVRLFGETVFPVCSPGYLRTHPQVADIENLPDLDLIEIRNAHTEWMNWKVWLSRRDLPNGAIVGKTVFNTYPLAIQAAVDGLGVALGWGHLVDGLLNSGKLVRPLGRIGIRTQSGYYLLSNQEKTPSPEQKIVEEWLIKISENRVRSRI